MMKYVVSGLLAFAFSLNHLSALSISPAPCGPVPTELQMRVQEMESYAFVHFSLNTYTDQSWGFGNEDVKLFNPKNLDCRQWARTCKAAGLKGVIITAKHHCGFCLWPSKYTDYSVKNAPWKDGKGDVVREMADACKEYGLKLGIYLSPWDRNHPDYGKPAYITYFRNQLTELLTNYGEIFEIWFDGANGGDGYYGGANETRKIDRTTYYDWKNTYALIRKLQPNCIIWNDGGDRGDLRWVGTEDGYVGETNWSLLNATGEVGFNMLHFGLESGNAWVPAEVNTSIRPEWFYHPSEDDKVKTIPQLMDLYYNSVGRNGTLLLNFPIMPNGLIHPTDEQTAVAFGQAINEAFAVNLALNKKIIASNVAKNLKKFDATKANDLSNSSYWTTDDNVKTGSLTLQFNQPTHFNRFLVQEYIRLGQRVKSFSVEAMVDGQWKTIATGTTIGYKRILRFPTVKATQVRLTITDAKCSPLISNIGIYDAPGFLNAPAISRNQSGEVSISSNEIGPIFYYTLDGSEPSPNSRCYSTPFSADGKKTLKAIAFDPNTKKSSPVATETFDISKKDWKVVGNSDARANEIFDGNINTAYHQRSGQMPIDLVVDMGKDCSVCGFKYLPDQGRWRSGVVTTYECYLSTDNVNWELVDKGAFSNIQNNPLLQVRTFTPVVARYIKFRALKNAYGDSVAGYAEVDVLTNQ